ncbi:hypothetical protein MD484_g6005, partial [Candolleomyces efflorescens]
MNRFYDQQAAARSLDAYMIKCLQTSDEGDYIGNLELNSATISAFQNPDCLRLTRTQNGELEEVVVRVPGILCFKTLPPVDRPLSANTIRHVRNLRQYVRISGLGSDTFNEFEDIVKSVHKMFSDHKGPDSSIPLPVKSAFESHFALDLHARYLTDRRVAPNERHIPFTDDVDPIRVLEGLRGARFIHTAENEVQYLKKGYDNDNMVSYERLPPREFKEGDMVEASFSFIAYSLGENKGYKLVLQLRSLALLSAEYRENSERRREEDMVNALQCQSSESRKRAQDSDVHTNPIRRRYIPTNTSKGATSSSEMNFD